MVLFCSAMDFHMLSWSVIAQLAILFLHNVAKLARWQEYSQSCELNSVPLLLNSLQEEKVLILSLVCCGFCQLEDIVMRRPCCPLAKLSLGYPHFFTLFISPAGSVKTWICWSLEQMPQISLALLSNFNGDELRVAISWISHLGCRETINLKATNIPKSYTLKWMGAPGSSALFRNKMLN